MAIIHTLGLPPTSLLPSHRRYKEKEIELQDRSKATAVKKQEQPDDDVKQSDLPLPQDLPLSIDKNVARDAAKLKQGALSKKGEVSHKRLQELKQVAQEALQDGCDHVLNDTLGYGTAEGREAKSVGHAAQKGLITAVTDEAQSTLQDGMLTGDIAGDALHAAGVAVLATAVHAALGKKDDKASGTEHHAPSIDGRHICDSVINAAVNGLAHTDCVNVVGAVKEGWNSDDLGKSVLSKTRAAATGKTIGVGVNFVAGKTADVTTSALHTQTGQTVTHAVQGVASHVSQPIGAAVHALGQTGAGHAASAAAHGTGEVVGGVGKVLGAIGKGTSAAVKGVGTVVASSSAGHAVGGLATAASHTVIGHLAMVVGAFIAPVAGPVLAVAGGTAAIVVGAHQAKRLVNSMPQNKKEDQRSMLQKENKSFQPQMG